VEKSAEKKPINVDPIEIVEMEHDHENLPEDPHVLIQNIFKENEIDQK
jgi:hypothetical protein